MLFWVWRTYRVTHNDAKQIRPGGNDFEQSCHDTLPPPNPCPTYKNHGFEWYRVGWVLLLNFDQHEGPRYLQARRSGYSASKYIKIGWGSSSPSISMHTSIIKHHEKYFKDLKVFHGSSECDTQIDIAFRCLKLHWRRPRTSWNRAECCTGGSRFPGGFGKLLLK